METLIKFLLSSYLSLSTIRRVRIAFFVRLLRFNPSELGGLQHFNYFFVGLLTLPAEQSLNWIGTALVLWGLQRWFLGWAIMP